jgi:hypothetical protein
MSHLNDSGRYYRFKVDRGLGEIGLEESKKRKEIAEATRCYVDLRVYLSKCRHAQTIWQEGRKRMSVLNV